MFRRFSIDFAIYMMIVDATLVALALIIAIVFRPNLGFILPIVKSYQGPYIHTLWLFPLFSITWVLVLVLFSAYDGRKNFHLIDELFSLVSGSILATVAIAGLLYLTYRDFSRALFGLFVLIAFGSMAAIRLVYRFIFRLQTSRGEQIRRLLVVGAGLVGKRIVENFNKFGSFGMQFVGYLDDDPKKIHRQDVLGTLDDARRVIQENHVDDVVMALPQRAYHRSNLLAAQLHDLPVQVWVIPDYFSLALNQAKMADMAGIPMIDLRAPALNDYQRMMKRAFDLLVSLLSLPFLLPMSGLIALAIKLDSPGPVLFRQSRVGENCKLFEIIKFRTMVEDAGDKRHVIERKNVHGRIIQNKTQLDPRITRVGGFLRRTSLDEIPQVINVLRGEMSWVGPRPELPYLVEQYEPWQRARFAVPQGMTGWWQVNGRSDKPLYLNTEDDLYYIRNYSIWLDIKIIFKTILAVIYQKGAY